MQEMLLAAALVSAFADDDMVRFFAPGETAPEVLPGPLMWPPAAQWIAEPAQVSASRTTHRYLPTRQRLARMVYTHPK